ncbi:MAG: Helicase c2 [Polaromonas sp.]|nr:Helicase c2 [Polaromonas sp.]
MKLELDVLEAFSKEGVLSRSIDLFMPRQGQIDMALAVARAIEYAETLVVEAGTGVGKTYAYLVPALLSGDRVLMSTATKALQDQLYGRDLPRLVEALGLPVETALLKGRSSYLCLHRLAMASAQSDMSDHRTSRSLGRIAEWAKVTRSGDLAELPGLDEKSPVIPLVTSTRENCLGSQCPDFRSCHVNLARKKALAADIVVVNHHLFFADLAVRESGLAELLPSVRVAIFDEAHQLNETGVQFLGISLTTGQLLDLCRDMLATGLQAARGLVDWQQIVASCEMAARDLRMCAGKAHPGSKLRWTDTVPEGLDPAIWSDALDRICASLSGALVALNTVSEIGPEFVRLHERAAELLNRANAFFAPCQTEFVRWVEVGSQLRLTESPLTIAKAVKAKMLEAPGEAGKTWIFTSATLGDDEKLSWFTQPCGLDDAKTLRVESPFDYAQQAALYVPPDFPKPSDSRHPVAVAECAARWSGRIGGRTLLLTTSLRALRVIGETLDLLFENSDSMEVLVQGIMPKRVLVERFRQGASRGQRGCVMVASASFWEGIDIPGDALQLVIIDKLPFPPPNDPMVEARSQALEAEGKSAFNHYFLPEAAVALNQGAGRLIRRETDAGILVVCDSRLASMGYGKRLIKALPPMHRLINEEALVSKLDSLTKTCTSETLPF